MTITFLGQSCFLIELGGSRFITDPFISPNEKAKHIDIEDIKVDYMLISHGHADHIADVEKIAQNNPDMLLISNWEIASYFGAKNIQSHPMNHGGKKKLDKLTLKYVPAIHSSSFPDGTYAGHPGGFVLWDDDHCVYFAGDTSLTMDMKLIPMLCPPLTTALLPIGDNFTMDVQEAVVASEFINCDKVIGCHFDTFGFIEINHSEAKSAFENNGKMLILPKIGERIDF